jgi:hypothetical protein
MNRCKIYPLSEVLFLCLISTICNARSFGEMVEFGELNLDWFRKYFPYESGVPSHDTLNRCMSLVCKVEMERMLQELIREIRPNVEGKQISIDGILKRKWFAKVHVLFCINPALKMLANA